MGDDVTQPRCDDCGLVKDSRAEYRCVCFKPAGASSAGWERELGGAARARGPVSVLLDLSAPRDAVAAAFYAGRDQGGLRAPQTDEEALGYPTPAVTSHDGAAPRSGWPAPVLSLAAEARDAGWAVDVAYARGSFPHGITGKPLAVRDSCSVRFSRGAWQGYAIYTGAAWKSIFVTGATLPPFGQMGRTELSAWLSEPDQPAGWYVGIKIKRDEQRERQREAAKARPKKAKEGAR